MDIFLTVGLLILMMIILIYLSGWFSGAETALTNLRPLQIAGMRKRKEKNVEYVVKLKKDLNRAIVTILIGNNVVNVLLSAVVALVADALFQTIGVSIALGVITFLIVVFGEITPKSYAIQNSETMALRNSKLIYWLMRLLSPLISFFIFITRGVLKIMGAKIHPRHLLVTEEGIMGLATLGQKEGAVKIIERDIIHKVFRFGDRRCKDVMVPMGHVFYLNDDVTFEEAKELLAEHGFTRVPVVDKHAKVVGVLYTKDLLLKRRGRVRSLMRKPVMFTEQSHVTKAFTTMKKKRVHMVIVKDRFGKHVGVITLEDILEELVGEIYDEYYKVKYKMGAPKE